MNKFLENDDTRNGILKSIPNLLNYLYGNIFSREKVLI
jgi:hypothetical protein